MDSDACMQTQFTLLNICSPIILNSSEIPFTHYLSSDSPPTWLDEQYPDEINICSHGAYVIYFYIVFKEPGLSCALFLNDHEITGTRCQDNIYGSTIILPTTPNPKCRITLQLIDFDSSEEAVIADSGYFLICKLL